VTSGVELSLFSSGMLGLNGVFVPVPFYLLRHSSGTVLVDGGNPLAVAHDSRAHWGSLADVFEVQMSVDQHCAAQLAALGVAPDSVTHLLQTHLHIDHTGGLGHFPQATVILHAREREAALAAESPAATGYVREDYDRPDLRWQTIDGDLDVFGDGTIRMIETPGHSAGHMSLLIELTETGPVLLTADATDNQRQWEGRDPVRALFSREQATRSLEFLRDLADRIDPLIVFGHDPKNWSQRRHAPERYV
jgi:N-acyl homoserine lactone hydrolase